MKYIAIIFLLLVPFAQACKKNALTLISSDGMPRSFNEVFEDFWNGMNRNYVYWDIDTTNWNSIYIRYKPLFNALNLSDQADLKKSVRYFREMTSGLVDAHYQVRFQLPALIDSIIDPAMSRKITDMAFHRPLSYFSIVEKKLDPGCVKGSDYANNQGNGPLFAMSGKINKTTLYFGFNEFSLFRSYTAVTDNPIKHVLQYFFDNLANNADSIKAIILDVRNNRGGDLGDLNFLVGHLISQPLLLGYFHTKRNNNPLDYTPWFSINISPAANSLKKDLRFILLADNFSASLSEAVVMALRTTQGATIIGETTYGATGPITGNEVYSAGSFSVGNFLSVQTSAAAFKYIDNESYEGKGIAPDIYIPFNEDSVTLGIDAVVNEAIRKIH